MPEYSISQALNENKLLKKRIEKEILNLKVVNYTRGLSKKIQNNETIEEFKSDVKNRYQKIIDLINNKQKLQSAIMLSNIQTKVKIDGIEYSVADALNFKQNIEFKKTLLAKMRKDLNETQYNVNLLNEQVEEDMQQILKTSNDNKSAKEDNKVNIETFTESYRKINSYILIDPLNCLKDKIIPLDEEIDSFISKVDYILSESNALTKINID